MTPAANKNLVSIQILRALAALLVVADHAAFLVHDRGFGSLSLNAMENATCGVDIFFVISGFIIVFITAGKENEKNFTLSFLAKRLLRIVPLYWFFTLLKVGMALVVPSAFMHFQVDWRHIFSSLFFFPVMDASGQIQFPVIGVGWTLVYEMFFYLLFACMLTFFKAQAWRATMIVLAALILCGQIFIFSGTWAPTFTNSIIAEFAFGCGIAVFYRHKKMGVTMALGFCLLGLLLFALSFIIDETVLIRPLRWGIPASLLVMGAVGLEQKIRTLRLHFLPLLGDASYSLYLIHGFALPIAGFIGVKLANKAWPLLSDMAMFTLALFLSAGVAIAFYLFAERPFITAGNKRIARAVQ